MLMSDSAVFSQINNTFLCCLLHIFISSWIPVLIRYLIGTQGVLGIKVKIMLDWDPKGKVGPTTPLPDLVTIHPPKEEDEHFRAPVVAADIDVLPVA